MSDLAKHPAPHLSTIVGVGASAGGLEAFTQLLQLLPEGSDLTFVLIQHLDPSHPSKLRETLARVTTMPVADAEQGTRVEAGHVYVITPNTELTLRDAVLAVTRPIEAAAYGPIDAFFRSLAAERGPRAVGVLLSGLASDGTEGLRAIRAAAGLSFAQAPSTAEFSFMPQSAVAAGVVDYALSIPDLATELLRLSRHPYTSAEALEAEDDLRFASHAQTRLKVASGTERLSHDYSALITRQLDQVLSARYSPPGVLVKENLEVVLFRGETCAYLQAAPGQPQNNLSSMASRELSAALREAITRAKRERAAVHLPHVQLDGPDATRACDLVVIPFLGPPGVIEELFIVLFEEPAERAPSEQTADDDDAVAGAKRARAEAEHADSIKADFLATLSHELRTPLASMLLNAQRLRDGDMLDHADVKRAGDSLERSVQLQAKLIDDLLDVSRIAAGKLTLECRAFDLCELARAVIAGMKPVIDAKQLQVKQSLARDLGPIWADPARTHQIIANLLSNAVKFTPRLGQVTLTVDAADGVACVRIADTGIGMSADFLPRAFTHFAQRDRSISRAYGGLGLGLALVRHLVEMQGGSVHAHSPGVDRGATFTVTFPFARATDTPAADRANPAASRSLDRTGRMKPYEALVDVRILFIDDDFRTREAVFEVLEMTGARVALAASVADGMMALDTFDPHVVVCDIAMPGEDGYAFIRKLRAREQGHDAALPVLALTALASVDDKRRALAAGFQLHLTKPIDIARLRDSVLELVRMRAHPEEKETVVTHA